MNRRTPQWMVGVGLLLLTASPARAQENREKPDPIDAEIEWLESKDPSTAGMVQAASRGCELWDRELNRVYQELLKEIAAAEREKLRSSQRAWVTFRDANRESIGGVYGAAKGTMYRPMAVYAELNVIKARAQQLRTLLEVAVESR